MREDNGWISAVAPEHVIERAVARVIEGDRVKSNDLANVGTVEQRARGFIGEIAFERWLARLGVEHVYDGGDNANPDFVIAGVSTALRTCPAQTPYTMSHHVYVFAAQMRAQVEERFFVGYEVPTKRCVLLGGMSAERYRRECEFVAKGRTWAGMDVRHDMWGLGVRRLELPRVWVARVAHVR